MKKVNIWDLDGTVINSFHRVQPCLLPNGDLDLQKYKREACTHDAIMADSLLPLVELMRRSMADPYTINYIVTARLLSKSDYYFLRSQGLRGRGTDNVQAFSRDTLHKFFPASEVLPRYNSGDASYKAGYFEIIRQRHPNSLITVYDDHQGVLATARDMGFQAVDAAMLNDLLDIGFRLGMQSVIETTEADLLDIEYLTASVDFLWQTMPDEAKENLSVKSLKVA